MGAPLIKSACFLLLFLVIPGAVAGKEADPGFVNKLLIEWEALGQSLTDVAGVMVKETRNGSEIVEKVEVEFIVAEHEQRFLVRSQLSGVELAHGQSTTKGYVFNLRRRESERPFAITRLSTFNDQPKEDYGPPIKTFVTEWLRAPLTMHGRTLPDIFSSPDFRLGAVSELEGGEIAVEFDYPGKPGKLSLLDSRVVLMPENHFSIDSYEAKTENFNVTGSIEYDLGTPEVAVRFPRIVKMAEWNGEPEKGELMTSYFVKFEDLRSYSASGDEFTLASFGVDEVSQNDGRIFAWVLLVAAGLLLSVIYFLTRNHKVRSDA